MTANGIMPRTVTILGLLSLCSLTMGCRYHVDWPDGPVETQTTDQGKVCRCYTIGQGSRLNYRQRLENGRVTTLFFDDDGDGRDDETVDLLGRDSDVPHFIIILDGVPFDVVQAMYEEGCFRLFGPPSRVVSVFPAMTDLALSRIFHTPPCIAAEALYFDREGNTLSDGNQVYLRGANAPWVTAVDYLAPQSVAVGTYLNPWSVFSQELRGMHRLFQRSGGPAAVAYSVGTAGIGTREGEKGIQTYLREVDKLCERITYDRRGRVRFSILADHGQGLQRCRRVSFRKTLTEAGFQVTKALRGPKDIVIISYGLVTYAQFHTDRPRAAAEALVDHPAVDLALFREDQQVIVRSARASAVIRQCPDGYAYDMTGGDPLGLASIIEELRSTGQVAGDGTIADRGMLWASADHDYPDPLHRIWTSFDGLVEKPADLIVSLEPDACHGSKFYHFFVAPVASTHGALDRLSSVTFVLTNATSHPLPGVLRVEDVLEALQVPGSGVPSRPDAPNDAP
jgi:hypothetical protein